MCVELQFGSIYWVSTKGGTRVTLPPLREWKNIVFLPKEMSK